MTAMQPSADAATELTKTPSPYCWQAAKQYAEENPLDLPDCAPGTPIYLVVPDGDRLTEIRLRAYARLIRRAGRRVKLLGG